MSTVIFQNSLQQGGLTQNNKNRSTNFKKQQAICLNIINSEKLLLWLGMLKKNKGNGKVLLVILLNSDILWN